MPLSIQEISDRFEIQDLIVAYCYAVDDRDFEALDDVFTPDAVIDYSEMVGVKGGPAAIKQFLAEGLAPISAYQHAVSTTQYRINGDHAETRSVCYNPMVAAGPDGVEQTFFFGLWYIHEFVRTPKGWRMSKLYERKCYNHNLPAWVKDLTS